MIAPENKIATARATYGRSIEEILAKEPQRGILKVLGAIEVLVGSKINQGLPTSLAERMVFAFTWLAREVNNGGFHQFFFNSAGDFWKDVLDGLVAIGDERGLVLFRRTLSIFPGSSPSLERFTRQEQLEKLEAADDAGMSEHFSSVTNEYFSNPFPNWDTVFDYVKNHAGDFDLRNA